MLNNFSNLLSSFEKIFFSSSPTFYNASKLVDKSCVRIIKAPHVLNHIFKSVQ